jgi:hypothetical protein
MAKNASIQLHTNARNMHVDARSIECTSASKKNP